MTRASGTPVWIEANGYVMRSIEPADITPEVVASIDDPVVLRGLNLRSLGVEVEGLRRMAANFDNRARYFVGVYRRDDLCRLLGFYIVEVNHQHRAAQVSVGATRQDGSGREVFWATLGTLLDHFYRARGVDKISARVLANNYRVLWLFKDSASFRPECVLQKECLMPDGRRSDVLIFSSFRRNWRKPVYQPRQPSIDK